MREKNNLTKTRILVITVAAVIIITAVCLQTHSLLSGSADVSQVIDSINDETIQPGTDKILSTMTLEEKVGQIFMVCFYSGTPSPEEVSEYNLGGVLLFGASFYNTSPSQLKTRLSAINKKTSLRPFIAVDEEGGTVVRASANKEFRSTPFKAPRDVYAKGGLDAIISDTHEKNIFLKKLGINLNLAPVCDISTNKKDFMYDRSLGQNADTTSDFASAVVETCLKDNMGCTLKHFPGYGNSADTHKGIVIDKRSMERLKNNDLLPFSAGINAGAPSVLVSHNIVKAIDPDAPASLSPAVHSMLRDYMGFKGVIITDDLSMDAIDEYFPDADSAVTAVLAGNDILCTGSFKDQYRAVLEAVEDGIITEDRLNQSVRRIISWKIKAGLINPDNQRGTNK